MATTIVVGFVPKPEGEAALGAAIDEARMRDARIVVVLSRRAGDPDTDAQGEVATVTGRLSEAGVEHEVRPLVSAFDPAEDLITVAAEVEASLLVIGLRRRSPVGKLVLGSNAQRILLDSPCAVLAVKP